MAIEFHCEHCGKPIRAGAEHAGRHGKCPSCHQRVYIPAPPEEAEPLSLAPIDPAEEAERERQIRETRELTRRILSERDKGYDAGPTAPGAAKRPGAGPQQSGGRAGETGRPGEAPRATGGSRPPDAGPRGESDSSRDVAMPKLDIETLVIEYAICMSDGELSEAADLAQEIRKNPAEANAVIQRLIMDEIPPAQLSRIPRPVLMGFLKQLREEKK